jgi:predicted Fe-Mo cluster-binding NifX family protein
MLEWAWELVLVEAAGEAKEDKGGDEMKVCIPTDGDRGLDEQLAAHFGWAATFTMVDMDTDEVRVIKNHSSHMGGTKLPPEILAEEGAEVMLVGGLGSKAVQMFEHFGIDVFIGGTGKVRDVIEEWKMGRLNRAAEDNACQEHQHH